MPVLYTNNAATTLASGITAAATSLTVASGKGALFPAPSSPSYFYATLSNADGSLLEIVKVTARATDTFTITRAQDGTSALAWNAGDKIELRITKSMLDDFKTDTNAALTSSNVTTALGYTPYNSSNPNGYITSSASITGTASNVTGTVAIANGGTGATTASAALTALGAYAASNPSGYISGINSSMVTSALGYTPYNSTNPNGYITSSGSISGNAATATTATASNNVNSPDGTRNAGDKLPTTNARNVRFDFASASSAGMAGGNYAGVMTYAPWDGTTASTGDASYQLAFGGTAVNGAGLPQLNIRKGIDSTWNSWYTLLHDGNYNSYSPTLTGGGASGSWGISITGSSGSCSGNAASATWAGYVNNANAYTNGTDGWWRSAGAAGWYNASYAVGIYATEAGNVRTYNGANFIAAGNVTAYSDERLKKNWKNLDANFIEQLAQVKCGTYERTDNEFAKVQVGASAQSLRNVLPEAILEDAEGILSVAYGNAALVAAIKLAERVVELEARLNAVEAK